MRPLTQAQTSELYQYDAKVDQFLASGQVDSLLHYNRLKLALCKSSGNQTLWAWVCMETADFLEEQVGEPAAGEFLETMWPQRWHEPQNAKDCEPFAYMLAGQARFHMQKGKFVQATQAYEQVASWYEKYLFPEFEVEEMVFKPLGNCYTRLGENDKAIVVFQKGLQFCSNPESMAGFYLNLGKAYWNKDAFQEADRFYHEGLLLNRISAQKRGLLLGALAQSCLDQNRLQEALQNVTTSLALLKNEPAYHSRLTAGVVYTRLKRWHDAEKALTLASKEATNSFGAHSRELAKCRIAQAELLLEQGRCESSLEVSNQALNAVLPWFTAKNPFENPEETRFYEENAIFEALAIKAAAAAAFYDQSGNLESLRTALECHRLAWRAETNLRHAYQYGSSKLFLQHAARKREEAAMAIARKLFEKTADQSILNAAFQIAERSKAALLSEAIHDNLIEQRLASADTRPTQLGALKQNLAYFEKLLLLNPESAERPTWQREADELLSQIRQLEQSLKYSFQTGPLFEVITIRDIQNLLSKDETFVEYFVTPETMEVFVVQKNQEPAWLSVPLDDSLKALVTRFNGYFLDPNDMLNTPAAYLAVAFQLGLRVLPPDVRAHTDLLIVPDGFVNFIPFDALLTDAPAAGTTLRNASYLIRKHCVRYGWSGNVLAQQQKLTSHSRQTACFAPGFEHRERGLAPLLFNPQESPADAQLFSGPAANTSNFVQSAGQHRILHLSTHAFASVENKQPPRLELFDQPLYLPDIYALRLQTDLVTLSACQTGLGRNESGEGVMSLARAFAQAGAACVVSSLWSVNDRSTGQILAVFYRQLAGGVPISNALRNAKLQYLEDEQTPDLMQSPYYWAGLSMVGDNRRSGSTNTGIWWWVLAGVGCLSIIWCIRYHLKKRNDR
ncbi:MAG: CHAT domain-containing protein [Saprospiraceae bacterium]|nr:CHAT domain-containing protein [Saprospiraceae bacterium]